MNAEKTEHEEAVAAWNTALRRAKPRVQFRLRSDGAWQDLTNLDYKANVKIGPPLRLTPMTHQEILETAKAMLAWAEAPVDQKPQLEALYADGWAPINTPPLRIAPKKKEPEPEPGTRLEQAVALLVAVEKSVETYREPRHQGLISQVSLILGGGRFVIVDTQRTIP